MERMIELKLKNAKCRRKLAEAEVASLQFQHAAWTATALLNKTREYAMRSHYHLSNDESNKAKEQLGELLQLLDADAFYAKQKPLIKK